MYENLNEFERALAKFGDQVAIVAGLEVSGKITQEAAFDQIKSLYKNVKKLYKKNKDSIESLDKN
jgi:hypothetical protein